MLVSGVIQGASVNTKAFLFKYHGNGDGKSQLADLEYREMRAVIEAEMANNTGWRFLLKTPGKRRRILVPVLLGLFSQWSGNGLVSYHLVRVLETAGMTNKHHFIILVAGMLAVFSAQTLCAGLYNERGIKSAGAEGFSVLMFFNKGSGFVNGFVNPIGLQALWWKYYIVCVVWLVVELACVYLFSPETSGRSLEAIAEVFNGPLLVDAEKTRYVNGLQDVKKG
ncbi:hypothetical protein VdG2_01668 [Verticillium dahliae VDG2]|nr:hypothetical protein VdG2_01668 [Verticillium dahliae VDG2]